MGIVGRMQVDHPALGETGGAALHAKQESNFTKISDNSPGRFASFTQADGTTFSIVHDFGVNLTELEVHIYSGTYPSLTPIDDPENLAVPYTISETSGSEKTSIDIQVPASGGPHTGGVIVLHNKVKELKAARRNVAVSAAATLSNRSIHLADSTGGAFSLTLPAPSVDLYIPIKDSGGDAANNNITIATPGAETIDGAASFDLSTNYGAIVVISDGTNYFIV